MKEPRDKFKNAKNFGIGFIIGYFLTDLFFSFFRPRK